MMSYFVMNMMYNTFGAGQWAIFAIRPTAPYRLGLAKTSWASG